MTFNEVITLEAYGEALHDVELVVTLESDFQPAVKNPGTHPDPVSYTHSDQGWQATTGPYSVRIGIDGPAPAAAGGTFSWRPGKIQPGDPFEVEVTVSASESGAGGPKAPHSVSAPVAPTLSVTSGPKRWRASVGSSVGDVAAPRMHVPSLDATFLAAGAPTRKRPSSRGGFFTSSASVASTCSASPPDVRTSARSMRRRCS